MFGHNEIKKRGWLDSLRPEQWFYPFLLVNFVVYILHGGGRQFGWLDRVWPSRRSQLYSNFGVFVSRTYFTNWWTWFTSAITHQGFFHLAMNMYCMKTFVEHNPYPSIDVINWFLMGAFWCGAFMIPFGYCVGTES